jgi:hypothetical protein
MSAEWTDGLFDNNISGDLILRTRNIDEGGNDIRA